MDNIGMPISGISLSYSNSGLIGSGDADILVSLKPGHGPTGEYVRRLRARLNREFPGTLFYFLPADIVSQTLNFGLPAPFNIQIAGRDQVKNREVASRLADKVRHIPGAVDVRVQQSADQPKLRFAIDRARAVEIGLSERDVANSVLLSLSGSGQVQPAFWLNPQFGIQYLINVRAPEREMDSLAALQSIPVSAIILIYFLLVVNFQSWLDPFIIITALPGALAGVVWALYLTLTTACVPALMGAIMSLGVATANSVLVVSFARDYLRHGWDSTAAALEAGASRLRPVFMTALAMVIGMLPMSLGLGEGGEQNAPLGRAVIGGLVLATVATLFFVPAVFSFMHRRTPGQAKAGATPTPLPDGIDPENP